MFAYKRRTVFLKGKRFIPIMDKERKLWASTGCVSFGRMTIDDGSILCGEAIGMVESKREHFTVMRLTSVANVSIGPLGQISWATLKCQPWFPRTTLSIPVIRQASECQGAGGPTFRQFAPKC